LKYSIKGSLTALGKLAKFVKKEIVSEEELEMESTAPQKRNPHRIAASM
jgi:hypothetical protein